MIKSTRSTCVNSTHLLVVIVIRPDLVIVSDSNKVDLASPSWYL